MYYYPMKNKGKKQTNKIQISRSIKIIAAGLFIPTIIILLLALIFVIFDITIYRTILFMYLIPLMWGLWNLFYHSFLKAGAELRKIDLFMVGGALGFIDAAIEISIVDMPSMLGLTGGMRYILLLIVPVMYGLIWTYLMKPLNEIIIE